MSTPPGVFADYRKSSSIALTEQLSRIWEECPNGILDFTEAKLEGLELRAEAVEVKDEPEEVEEVHDRSQLMAYQDMQKLRDMLFDQLKYVYTRTGMGDH